MPTVSDSRLHQLNSERGAVNRLMAAFPALPYDYIYTKANDVWDGREAEIMAAMPESFYDKKAKLKAPSAAMAPEIAIAYSQPLLSKEQEQHLARRMNYCKSRATELFNAACCGELKRNLSDDVRRYSVQADCDQDLLVGCNLRLVINLTKKRARTPQQFMDLLSDGNLALIKAVQKFDYSRNFRFSTYATWAIIKNQNRSIWLSIKHGERYITNCDDYLETVIGVDDCDDNGRHLYEREHQLHRYISDLKPRDKIIVELRNGFGGPSPTGNAVWTLEEVGRRLGISKERVRQIHKGIVSVFRYRVGATTEC